MGSLRTVSLNNLTQTHFTHHSQVGSALLHNPLANSGSSCKRGSCLCSIESVATVAGICSHVVECSSR